MDYKKNGVSLEQLFDPYVEGNKVCPAGKFKSNNADIRDAFAPISVGTKAANVGYQINGTDISNYFAAKGSAVYWDGTLSALPTGNSDSGSGPRQAIVEVGFYSNGLIKIKNNYPYGEPSYGSWTGEIADSSNTEVRFVVVSGSLDNNDAITFQRLSSSRFFYIGSYDEGFKSAIVRVELRKVGNAGTVITKEIEISVAHNSNGEPDGPGGT